MDKTRDINIFVNDLISQASLEDSTKFSDKIDSNIVYEILIMAQNINITNIYGNTTLMYALNYCTDIEVIYKILCLI